MYTIKEHIYTLKVLKEKFECEVESAEFFDIEDFKIMTQQNLHLVSAIIEMFERSVPKDLQSNATGATMYDKLQLSLKITTNTLMTEKSYKSLKEQLHACKKNLQDQVRSHKATENLRQMEHEYAIKEMKKRYEEILQSSREYTKQLQNEVERLRVLVGDSVI